MLQFDINENSTPKDQNFFINQPISAYQYINPQFNRTQISQKVLVNPHFRAKPKVFLNPNFQGELSLCSHIPARNAIHVNPLLCSTVVKPLPLSQGHIHVNPNINNVQVPKPQTVHVNPKFKDIKGAVDVNVETVPKKQKKVVVLTKTKLIRSPVIIKKVKKRIFVKSKFKIVRAKANSPVRNFNKKTETFNRTRFKIDNRKGKLSPSIKTTKKQYSAFNKWSLQNNNTLRKQVVKPRSLVQTSTCHSLVNISGVLYKKSNNCLKKAGSLGKTSISKQQLLKSQLKLNISKVKLKLNSHEEGRSSKKIVKKFKIIRKQTAKKTKFAEISPKKLKKYNIPCTTYRKYGICKENDNGKCPLKHDPLQIALCTRFLQGACLKNNCLLSHNVSPEKMPTCKYFLEGSCSRENCPYLHVKISSNSEVCRDFLEGFCKKAAECEKRHQFLCPDHEKYGVCQKQRCLYPHGKMVRKYIINKEIFVKKCSDPKPEPKTSESETNTSQQRNDNLRYYVDMNDGKIIDQVNGAKVSEIVEGTKLKTFVGLHSRPKLGNLPSFISF
ncbi:zinc finger CCCH domain-containing protein 3 isoform X2 [Euwallacea fornicatus]|uniref:zinc finger CCCH domain-containing protein 3 isoform X2 n=1 Tax=Euwallacea fornicatus TaxID=995702 RepID=UPI00338D8BF1